MSLTAGTGEVTSLELPIAVGQTLITPCLTYPPQDLLQPDLSPAEMFLFSPPDVVDDEDSGGQGEADRHHQEHQAADSEVSLVKITD